MRKRPPLWEQCGECLGTGEHGGFEKPKSVILMGETVEVGGRQSQAVKRPSGQGMTIVRKRF